MHGTIHSRIAVHSHKSHFQNRECYVDTRYRFGPLNMHMHCSSRKLTCSYWYGISQLMHTLCSVTHWRTSGSENDFRLTYYINAVRQPLFIQPRQCQGETKCTDCLPCVDIPVRHDVDEGRAVPFSVRLALSRAR